MTKQAAKTGRQKTKKAPAKSARQKSTQQISKPSKEHLKQGAVNTFWVVFGIVLCVVVVVSAIFTIDWFVYKHECEERILDTDPIKNALIGPTQEQAQGCNDYRIFFLRNNS